MSLVLLHPIGLDGDCWQFLSPETLYGARTFTMMWHGQRPFTKDEPRMQTFADDVAAQVPDEIDLVGLSMGGAVAQEFAIRYPRRVRSLMIVGSFPGSGDPSMFLQRAHDVARSGMSAVIDTTLQRWFSSAALVSAEHPGVAYARERLVGGNADAFAASWRALATHNSLGYLHEIIAPTTVLSFSDDVAVPKSAADEMVAAIPTSRLATLPGPHLLPLESPRLFDGVLKDHLAWSATFHQ